jgi:hypothetical protein
LQAQCTSPSSSSIQAFVARAGLSIEFAGSDERMRLAAIDRRGFTVGVTDDAQLPPQGLPRQARVTYGGETLCEARLVARCPVQGQTPVRETVLQPSRSDDDIAFWQALYAHRLRQRSAGGGHPIARRDSLGNERYDALQAASSRALTDGEAIFVLSDASDAAFFAAWLEYHFAEAVARTRAASTPAELRDMACRTENADVIVCFEYRFNGKAAHAATRETCAWIAAEVERLFGLAIRYEVADTRQQAGAMSYRQRRTTLAS